MARPERDVFDPYMYFAYVYFVVRMVMPLPISKTNRVLLAAGTLLICKHHLIQKWVFGTMFSPEMPRLFVILLGWLYCTFVLLLLICLLSDIVLLLAWAARRGRRIEAPTLQRVRMAMTSTALCLSAIGVYQAIQVPEVRRLDLAVRDLPPSLDGFRVVQLSDLHISRLMHQPWVQQVVARTNAIAPDLIVITGDLIDGTLQARHDDVQPLAGLRARHGVVASLGNHEYYFGAVGWAQRFRELGMTMLINQNMAINDQQGKLYLAGTTDPVAQRYGLAAPDIVRAMQGIPAHAQVILMSHQPIDAKQHEQLGVDVQLSGHTHGGMVRGIDLIVAHANNGYVSGLYNIGAMRLYVSNGTGLWNGFPIRLGVPAEITEFTLRPMPVGAPLS